MIINSSFFENLWGGQVRKNNSYADRLLRARDMHSILKGFQGYDPPRTTESLEGFQDFIETLVLANKNVANQYGIYRLATGNRSQLFLDSENSVIKLFSGIMLYIKARYGNKSSEYAILSTIMKKMRSSKLVKNKPADSNTENAGENNEEQDVNSANYTRSARSYGTPDLSKLVRQNQFLDNIRKFLSNRGPDFSFFSGYSIGNSCIIDPFYFSNKLFNRHMSLYFNMPGND